VTGRHITNMAKEVEKENKSLPDAAINAEM
jgi:hypothetical protein